MSDERDPKWAMIGPFLMLTDPTYDPEFEGECSVDVQVGDMVLHVRVDAVTPIPDDAGSWLSMAWLGPHDLDVLHSACFHVATEHNDRDPLRAYERIQEYIKATNDFQRGRVGKVQP